MNTEIESLISQYEGEGFFTRIAPSPETIAAVEETLGLMIPKQFVDYLNVYSHGGINGTEILGVGMNGRVVFLDVTLQYRAYGMPDNLLVIERCDEWVYCLDCTTEHVVSWSQEEGVRDEYSCFDDFLLSDLKEAIDNL